MTPTPEALRDLVNRIVGAASPLRIILFGSAARGEMSQDSDLDVLVVMPDDSDCRAVARTLYRRLRGFPYASDILVVPQKDMELYADNPSLVIHTALSGGKELYHAVP
ncbi:MAG: nucleotidyltransferase domain-containing protein [Planctomycetes bacterium]|nr:nucleotidyltransferase domain-containing protein [Planctomycetota bacterium]